MALFSDSVMQDLSSYFAALACKDDVDIIGSTRVPDGQQGFRETWATDETVKCLVVSSGMPRLEQIAQQTVGRDETLFCFPVGTSVTRANRLGYNGDIYEIIDLLDRTTYTVFLRLIAKHMEAGSGS